MEGTRGRRARARRQNWWASCAQATVEFAFVAPLFLLCFLGAVDSGLWALQNAASVSAVEAAARAAASAGGGPLANAAPDARAITAVVDARLRQSLFATRIVAWQSGCPASAADVQAAFGPRVVAVCVVEHRPPACTTPPPGVPAPYPPYCSDTPTITVRIAGYVAALVPPGFGPAAQGGELPEDVAATTHTLRFAP